MIEIQPIDKETYAVKVFADRTTEHQVMLDDSYYLKLTHGEVLPEELIEQSFNYLLERDGRDDLPPSVDLSVLQLQHADYETEMKRRIGVRV